MKTSARPLDVARAAMDTQNIDAMVIGPGADLIALTGYRAHASERMTALVVIRGGESAMIVPRLERDAAGAAVNDPSVRLIDYPEGEDAAALVAEWLAQSPATPADPPTVAVGDQFWARFLLEIQTLLDEVNWQPASPVSRHFRMVKDAVGLAGLRRAGAAIDQVHRSIPSMFERGMTERDLGRLIDQAMRDAGHDHADFVIVASGSNGASPHHETGDRIIGEGDGVVIDIGGPVAGWFSDCTRNYVVGVPNNDYQAAFAVLHRAQKAAVAAVRPGVCAAAVDVAARSVISAAGFGDAFVHRTGHGIGLEVHEEPYITSGSDLLLEEGMTFSIEPGIYLDDRFGMRIEDIVAVTSDGAERLNTTSTDLVAL